MSLFKKRPAAGPENGQPAGKTAFPGGFNESDIKIESSTCTGEKTIGFYSAADKKLHYAELVRSPRDIAAFYEKYGVKTPEK